MQFFLKNVYIVILAPGLYLPACNGQNAPSPPGSNHFELFKIPMNI